MSRSPSFYKTLLVLAAFLVFTLSFAPSAIAHHDNEAEHQTAVSVAGEQAAQTPVELPPTTAATPSPTKKVYPPSELVVETLFKPDNAGRAAEDYDRVYVHYVGTLWDGTQFDSSVERAQPFGFSLSRHQVIKGWDLGVKGMVVGEKRKLIIPPHLGYGDRGFPPVIPAGATLVFTVEMMEIQPAHPDL